MGPIKKSLSILFPAMRMSFALVMITICIILSAEIFGFMPQEDKFIIDARTRISESLTLQMSVLIPDEDINKIQRLIRFMVKRNPDILSAGIRNSAGQLIFQSANHEELWTGYDAAASTTTHVFVPILQNGELWGNVELRFEEIKSHSLLGFLGSSIFRLILFMILVGFVVYLIFMLRTLRQLDPSSVIPDRVNAAFDTLAEGIVIVDEKEQVLLANKSFREKIGMDLTTLLGTRLSDLQWKSISANKSGKRYPWQQVIKSGKNDIGSQLIYQVSKNNQLKFAINASPILGANGQAQGVLITLDDISELEQRNTELKTIVTRLQKTQFQVQKQNQELTYLATRDPMTGCLNRRSFSELFEGLFQEAQNNGTELACIMVDIDHFKAVNDNFGHATGDEVIKMLAEILKSNTRSGDLVSRYGGEEFCLVLPGMSDEVAKKTAERIRLRIKDESTRRYEAGPRVTASLGIASMLDNPESPDQLNNIADQALYVAKESGRNKVVRWQPGDEKSPQPEPQVAETVEQDPVQVQDLKHRIHELEEVASSVSAELEYNQSYDPLTGLPNQVLFYDRINQAVERGYRHDQIAAVLIIDIEMFSQINTSLGREKGDQLLREFAERLNAIFRKTDGVSRLTVSRFTGDEFAVLLTDIATQQQVTWAVKRLLETSEAPISIDGHIIHLNIKVGISLYPQDATSAEQLFNHAMLAKQHCKRTQSGSSYHFFDNDMQLLSEKYLKLETELFQAIEEKQWILLYQPKLDVGSGKIVGAEALIRWQHPRRGTLSPFEFMEFAEQRKLIIPIGDWVMREVCRKISEFQAQGFTDFSVAINLSTVQLVQPDIVQKVFDALEEFKVPPRLLELEITETALIENIQAAIESLKRLHARGIRISIDDFGTGYSSLSYLKNLPIDCLKIDRSFVMDICDDKNDEQIVRTLISMAHSLNLKVVAEGVEDAEQLVMLNEFDCDEIQGYLLSRPVVTEVLLDIMKNPAKYTAALPNLTSVEAVRVKSAT